MRDASAKSTSASVVSAIRRSAPPLASTVNQPRHGVPKKDARAEEEDRGGEDRSPQPCGSDRVDHADCGEDREVDGLHVAPPRSSSYLARRLAEEFRLSHEQRTSRTTSSGRSTSPLGREADRAASRTFSSGAEKLCLSGLELRFRENPLSLERCPSCWIWAIMSGVPGAAAAEAVAAAAC